MGTVCAWCSSVLRGCGTSDERINHTICEGCLAELRSTLAREGVVLPAARREAIH